MNHFVAGRLLKDPIRIALIGAGGNGSQMLDYLVRLHRGLLARGHPHGLDVLVVDQDTVSAANIGRQVFYPSDVGSYKSVTLVNRANMAAGTRWRAEVGRVTTESSGLSHQDFVIGALDNRRGRLGILRSLESALTGSTYYLDMGNRTDSGQVVLGQVSSERRVKDDPWRLPHVGELFPELIDAALDKHDDDTPSCSLAEALEKQNLFVNPSIALFAAQLLWQLFTEGQIAWHGAFVSVKDARVMPLEISHETWSRFGVIRDGRRHKVVQPSKAAAKNRKAATAV